MGGDPVGKICKDRKKPVSVKPWFLVSSMNWATAMYTVGLFIHWKKEGGRIMYRMIHASDHEEAPKLMERAYRSTVNFTEPKEQFKFQF